MKSDLVPLSLEASSRIAIDDGADLTVWTILPPPLSGLRALLAAALTIGIATALAIGLSRVLPQQSIQLVLLLAVILSAIGFGVWTGAAAAVLAFLSYNYFFIAPLYTFTVADPKELFALVVFLAVAVLTGSLAGRMREEADAARSRAEVLQSLNVFAGEFARTTSLETVQSILTAQVATTIRGSAIAFMGGADDLAVRAQVPPAQDLQPADWQAARHALRSGNTVYAPLPGWPGATYEFRPVGTDNDAVIGFKPGDGRSGLASDEEAAFQVVMYHAAIALERTRLETVSHAARETAERERLRASLLSSLSHDLRTPLASILGAVTSLRQLGASMSRATHDDLLESIEEETGRLSRFVSNLLDMTKLETDAIDVMHDWVDPADVARHAVSHAESLFPANPIDLQCAAGTPLVRGDATLLEHVIFNLIENAIKFSGAGKPVNVRLSMDDGFVDLAIEDEGRGIAPESISHVFEKFYRGHADDRSVPGTGLGLAIAQLVVLGMRGTIDVQSPIKENRGTRFTLHLPIATTEQATGDVSQKRTAS